VLIWPEPPRDAQLRSLVGLAGAPAARAPDRDHRHGVARLRLLRALRDL